MFSLFPKPDLEQPEQPHRGGKRREASEPFLPGFTGAITQDLLRNPAERTDKNKSILL
jgi:hypothetical protein